MKKTRKGKYLYTSLALTATRFRTEILEMIVGARGSHIASAFSIIDILTVLYDQVLLIDPKHPENPKRDKFVLSKGHGCAALYVTLANYGFFPKKVLASYCMPGGILGGHPDSSRVPGVETSTGSLGHGLSVAVGFALAQKIDKSSARVYCLVGDGECNEGAIWEAIQVAAHHKLDNLTLIVDDNKIMIGGFTKDIINPLSFVEKFTAFGWHTLEIDGHNFRQIAHAFETAAKKKGKPTVIIANTVKGKGVSYMENDKEWHGALPNEEQMKRALGELRDRQMRLAKKIL
jgi:transketolase